MDIETKLYRIQSEFGGITILHKPTGSLILKSCSSFPSVNTLALMTEASVDRLCKAIIEV